MLKQFFARNRKSPDFYESQFDTKTLKMHVYHSEHEFWAIKRAIRTKIATCGLAEETEKRKKAGKESHKTVIFHYHVEAPFRNLSAPNLVSL